MRNDSNINKCFILILSYSKTRVIWFHEDYWYGCSMRGEKLHKLWKLLLMCSSFLKFCNFLYFSSMPRTENLQQYVLWLQSIRFLFDDRPIVSGDIRDWPDLENFWREYKYYENNSSLCSLNSNSLTAQGFLYMYIHKEFVWNIFEFYC